MATIAAVRACKQAGYQVVEVVVRIGRECGRLLKARLTVEANLRKHGINKQWEYKGA